jgi:hypothetical protein
MSARFTGTPSLSPRHVCQIHGHTKLVTPACLPDSWAHQACYPGMSARFTGTPSLLPRHVCQIHGHTKLVTPACLPDSWAPQSCPPRKTASFPGTSIPGHLKVFRHGFAVLGARAWLGWGWITDDVSRQGAKTPRMGETGAFSAPWCETFCRPAKRESHGAGAAAPYPFPPPCSPCPRGSKAGPTQKERRVSALPSPAAVPSAPSVKSADLLGLGGLTGRGGRAAQKRRSPRRCARSGVCRMPP